MKYELFFFKENTRAFDVEALIEFLLEDENMEMVKEEDKVSIVYKNKLISLDFNLIFTRMSRVPDLSRINAKYLDLDFYVEIDAILPMFKLDMIIGYVEKICTRFNFLIYNVLFEEPTTFRRDIINQSYDIVRRNYKEKFPMEYSALNYIMKNKLEGYYKYIVDAKSINTYYNNQYAFLNLYFAKNLTFNQVNLVVELSLESATIIPPFVDIIAIEVNGMKQYYDYRGFLDKTSKYIVDLPGFIGNTKKIDAKSIKKVKKIVNKMKLTPILDKMEKINEESLIDF